MSRITHILEDLQAAPVDDSSAEYIREQLQSVGATKYNLLLPETHILPRILHRHEQIIGVIYGRYRWPSGGLVGRGALVATDSRVFLIDHKPLFIWFEELIYPAIIGSTYTRIGPIGYLTLHSKEGDIKIQSFNRRGIQNFMEAVESKLYVMEGGGNYDYT